MRGFLLHLLDKLQHWRGFQSTFGLGGSPVLGFVKLTHFRNVLLRTTLALSYHDQGMAPSMVEGVHFASPRAGHHVTPRHQLHSTIYRQTPNMHRVLIVEDDSAFRARFEAMLVSDPAFEIVASVGTGGEGLAMLDLRKPDILLVDLGLPDLSGIEVIRHANHTLPACECMVVTVFGDEEHVLASIEAGAAGYLLKDASEENFLSGIRELMSGGSPISPIIARRLLKRFHADPAPVSSAEAALAAEVTATSDVALSDREHEILVLASKGFNYPEMGKLMGISPHTVTSHVKKIYRKLAVHSRGEAVFEANRMGLIHTL